MERILHSAKFRHADQLRHLFSYLAEKSLSGEADALKEYTVGIEALGKPSDYDPRRDAAARIQAGRLRAKLEEYYRSDGASDEIVVSMPKGAFRLEFSTRAVPEAMEPADVAPVSRTVFWQFSTALLAAALAAAIFWPARSPASGDPWKPFFSNGRPAVVSVGPHLFAYMDGIIVRDWTANRWEDVLGSSRVGAVRQALGNPNMIALPIYAGLGEMSAALSITRLFHTYGKDVEFRRSPQLSWDDLKRKNVVLLGSPKTIAHLKDLRDFVDGLDLSVEENRILNRRPASGEHAAYVGQRVRETMEMTEAFGLITFLPGVDGRGALMMIGSPDGDGILAASEAMSTPAILSAIETRVQGASKWQVLIKSRMKDMVPLDTVIVAHRRIQRELPGE